MGHCHLRIPEPSAYSRILDLGPIRIHDKRLEVIRLGTPNVIRCKRPELSDVYTQAREILWSAPPGKVDFSTLHCRAAMIESPLDVSLADHNGASPQSLITKRQLPLARNSSERNCLRHCLTVAFQRSLIRGGETRHPKTFRDFTAQESLERGFQLSVTGDCWSHGSQSTVMQQWRQQIHDLT